MRTKSCIGLIVLIVLCLSSAWLIGQSIGGSKSLTQSSMQALVGGANCNRYNCNKLDQDCGCVDNDEGVALPPCRLAKYNTYRDYNRDVIYDMCEGSGTRSCTEYIQKTCYLYWHPCVGEAGYHYNRYCNDMFCAYNPDKWCRKCLKPGGSGTPYYVYDWDCEE